MEMASSSSGGGSSNGSVGGCGGGAATRTTNVLPSLFADHGLHIGGGSGSLSSGKDLDGLIAMNDSALSQQIEFILQDAPLEQDDDDEDEHDAAIAVAAHVNQLDNPPTTTTTGTSASQYSHLDDGHHNLQAVQQEHLLNGRRIIIQSTESLGCGGGMCDEEEDPELNDENLQDIEDEAQAEEDDDEDEEDEDDSQQVLDGQIKQEEDDDLDDTADDDDNMEFISTPTISHHAPLAAQQTQQLVLPAGSIVSTSRGISVPVSEALAQLQRRPVYISSGVGAAFVRMPAVISRSPMTVLNVVQQGMAGVGPTTQLILQATPVSSAGTPVVVTSSAPAATQLTAAVPVSVGISVPMSMPVQTVCASSMSDVTAVATPSIVSVAATSTSGGTLPPPSSSATHTSSGVVATSVPATATTTTTATNSNTPTTTYQCHECVEKFDSKELFDIHRSGHANNMKCAICNMVLKSLKNYEKHCLRCKPYECQICGRVVRFRPNFIKHMRVHTGQQSERHKYKCDVCHKEFMSFEYFKVHKKIHNENVNLTCEICGKVFSALASLRGHSKLHSGVKLHKCDVCGKGFGQRYNLKIHARTHTGDFPFECKVCKKKLHTQSSLQTHMQVHQRDQTSQVTTTIKYEATATNAAAPSTSNTVGGNGTAIIVKLEPQTSLDGPSTSGLQQHQQQQEDMDDNSGLSGDGGAHIVSTTTNSGRANGRRNAHPAHTIAPTVAVNANVVAEDSSNESSNASHELPMQQPPQQLMLATPTRTIVIKNYVPNDQSATANAVLAQQQHHAQVIQGGAGSAASSSSSSSSSSLQQQLLRKTPIIHSTGTTLSSALASVVQQTGTSPSPSPSSSSTSCSSSVVVPKSAPPLSLASAAIGTSTIRSTHTLAPSSTLAALSGSSNSVGHQRVLQRSNNHRNHHHRRRHHLDDDDDDDDVIVAAKRHHTHHHHHNHRHHANLNSANGQHFDDDDDDEKSSPSLASTAAAIKVEPNLYSSGSGDNSNEMLIKEEVLFEDSAAPHSPHSPPSSKFRMSNFDSDLVDHHVDLNNSLPPYGNLFEPHSIPDSIPVQLYPDDDDDFRLDHSSLGALHNTSSSTTDGDFIKKEWVYGAGSSYTMNGKFDDDSDALCDAANFIYH